MSFYHKYLELIKKENYNEMAVSGTTKALLGANKVLKTIGTTSAIKNVKETVSAVNSVKQLAKKPNLKKTEKVIKKITNVLSEPTTKATIGASLMTKYLGKKSENKNTGNDENIKEFLNLIQKNYTILKKNIFSKIEARMKKEKDNKEKANEIKMFYALLQKDDFIEYIFQIYPKYKDDFKFDAAKVKAENFIKNIEEIVKEVENDLLKIDDLKIEVKKFPLLKNIDVNKIISNLKTKTIGEDDKKVLEIANRNFKNFHENFLKIVKENSGNYRIPSSSEDIFRSIIVSMGDLDRFIKEMPNLNNFKNLSNIEKIKFLEDKIKTSGLKTGIENNSLLEDIN